ncbi:quercetin dioxygenase-like cupin family protein [Gelidibacter sediminis]|uniref:Quercetin dioxygenase-like cupin family protein n=1 Tax=Gelidibacter sediminis TaxID=1608710 RepID=A0A4V3F964_9FLAO|nr:cupin [Gelidibacter sediminis]TDU43016.1 quercetin dioxygenase-like cupin family protein [Gelidibacter sediminis]
MKIASLTQHIIYHDSKPTIQVLMETESGKEIRIAFKKDQIMKKHKTPFPIVVEIFEGQIDFGVNEMVYTLNRGELVALEGGVPHDLTALADSIVRLSLNKADSAQRVEDVADQ